mmetsp:Transcript_21053/g.48746  ORF Transcript_21053/g.48746 Transcript_21053/m.48746 type:complete len:260 (-) Transcript_21053:2896-3675(-)
MMLACGMSSSATSSGSSSLPVPSDLPDRDRATFEIRADLDAHGGEHFCRSLRASALTCRCGVATLASAGRELARLAALATEVSVPIFSCFASQAAAIFGPGAAFLRGWRGFDAAAAVGSLATLLLTCSSPSSTAVIRDMLHRTSLPTSFTNCFPFPGLAARGRRLRFTRLVAPDLLATITSSCCCCWYSSRALAKAACSSCANAMYFACSSSASSLKRREASAFSRLCQTKLLPFSLSPPSPSSGTGTCSFNSSLCSAK